MSVPVAMDELARRVEEFGTHPFLVTTSPDGRAHVVSITVAFDDAQLSLRAGRTSRANVAETASVTLLWPGNKGPYGLIVDGTAHLDGETMTVTPTKAVLHRLADASEALPSCVPIETTA